MSTYRCCQIPRHRNYQWGCTTTANWKLWAYGSCKNDWLMEIEVFPWCFHYFPSNISKHMQSRKWYCHFCWKMAHGSLLCAQHGRWDHLPCFLCQVVPSNFHPDKTRLTLMSNCYTPKIPVKICCQDSSWKRTSTTCWFCPWALFHKQISYCPSIKLCSRTQCICNSGEGSKLAVPSRNLLLFSGMAKDLLIFPCLFWWPQKVGWSPSNLRMIYSHIFPICGENRSHSDKVPKNLSSSFTISTN